MAVTTFDDILAKGMRQGVTPGKTTQSRDWFRRAAMTTTAVNSGQLLRADQTRLVKRPVIGHMYLFKYDPKGKETLPYYDVFPLIFPFESSYSGTKAPMSGQSFLGINLHYLPLRMRAKLMDKLYDIATDKRYDDNTRLKISYDILKAASKFALFQPCIKRYLVSHIKSRFFQVHSDEWDLALFLPLQKFVGASMSQVHKESMARFK